MTQSPASSAGSLCSRQDPGPPPGPSLAVDSHLGKDTGLLFPLDHPQYPSLLPFSIPSLTLSALSQPRVERELTFVKNIPDANHHTRDLSQTHSLQINKVEGLYPFEKGGNRGSEMKGLDQGHTSNKSQSWCWNPGLSVTCLYTVQTTILPNHVSTCNPSLGAPALGC